MRRHTDPALHRRRSPGFAWLLWLALLLPVSQVAAAAHAFTHLAPAGVAKDSGKQALHPDHCGLCLGAAAVGAGAPPAVPVHWQPDNQAHPAPARAVAAAPALQPARAYRSRAPPFVRT